MSDEALTQSTPSIPNAIQAAWKKFPFGFSFSRLQAVVGTLAGIVSVGGAL